MKLKNIISENKLKYVGGLYQAKPGDMLWIGISGMVGKDRSNVVKIYSDRKVADDAGNIFNPDGRLYRSKNPRWQKKTNPNKIVSAKIATQTDFDIEYKKIKVDFLRKFNWETLNVTEIEQIINQLPIRQANKLNTSRFK
jgi:hypothetical protein